MKYFLGFCERLSTTGETFTPASQREQHPILLNMIFTNFFSSFVGYFSRPGSGSGSTDPIESESNPDQDPKDRKALKTWKMLRMVGKERLQTEEQKQKVGEDPTDRARMKRITEG
jgi:hypothetical protein